MPPAAISQGPRLVKHAAIIGAGVAGLTTALLLQRESISFDVYDGRDEHQPPTVGATIALAPNCLKLLDSLGVYQRIRGLGYSAERLNIVDSSLEPNGVYCMGDVAEFGYPNLRIYRRELVDQMTELLKERKVGERLHWRVGFSHIVQDDEQGVRFQTTNGCQHQTDVVIGADGIYSKARKHITSIHPLYTGTLVPMGVVTGPLPRPSGRPDFAFPAAIQGEKGSYMINPQRPNFSEVLCFRQIPGYPEQSREGWQALAEDKEHLMALLRGDKDAWPEYVQRVMEAADIEHMTMWAVYEIPDLDTWASPTKRVILIGDAAHAIPPSSGQGAAQAIEDGYSLGLVLRSINQGTNGDEVMSFWQTRRGERIGRIKDVARQNHARRLPQAERDREIAGKPLIGSVESMRWLHAYDVRKDFAG